MLSSVLMLVFFVMIAWLHQRGNGMLLLPNDAALFRPSATICKIIGAHRLGTSAVLFRILM